MLSFRRLNRIHGDNNIVETNEDNVSIRFEPPISLTKGLLALLKPISSNRALRRSKTPPL